MKNRLKVYIASLTVFLLGVVVFTPTASAFDLFGDACTGEAANSSVCTDADGATGNPIAGPDGVINTLVEILSIIIGVAAVIVIIIAGIQYMLSTGDSTKTNNAKNAILYALIGLGVAVAARVIVPFILQRL